MVVLRLRYRPILAQVMKLLYQYRFYPTDQQQKSLTQLFGCCCVAWNDALAFCQVKDTRTNFLHKLSIRLICENQAIILEA
jgi:putative transposase